MDLERIACRDDDERYMLEALRQAAVGSARGEVPVGAVIVKDGEIIARAHNCIETDKRSSAHAEMIAIEEAEKSLSAKWLTECTMYVTLEPCSMCAGALVLSRIERLVIGTNDPKTGACGSLFSIATDERLNHRIEIRRGVLRDECSAVLKEFFRERRG